MLPVFIPYTEPKKNYKFIWYIGRDDIFRNTAAIPLDVRLQFSNLMTHLLTTYVAQLAETVNPPDDNIETEDYNIGMVKVPVPTGVEMPDIVVTYLDDSNDTVYNFHKSWQSFVRLGDTFCLESLYPYAINARYITYENTLTASEHIGYTKVKDFDAWVRKNANIENPSSGLSLLTGNVDVFMKPHSIYNFPYVFPINISRDASTKSGTELSKVTVTYKRLPKIKKSKNYTNLQNKKFFIKDTNENSQLEFTSNYFQEISATV